MDVLCRRRGLTYHFASLGCRALKMSDCAWYVDVWRTVEGQKIRVLGLRFIFVWESAGLYTHRRPSVRISQVPHQPVGCSLLLSQNGSRRRKELPEVPNIYRHVCCDTQTSPVSSPQLALSIVSNH